MCKNEQTIAGSCRYSQGFPGGSLNKNMVMVVEFIIYLCLTYQSTSTELMIIIIDSNQAMAKNASHSHSVFSAVAELLVYDIMLTVLYNCSALFQPMIAEFQ